MISCTDKNKDITNFNYCKTTIYQNILTNFKYVSVYANSNPNYIMDWVEIVNS